MVDKSSQTTLTLAKLDEIMSGTVITHNQAHRVHAILDEDPWGNINSFPLLIILIIVISFELALIRQPDHSEYIQGGILWWCDYPLIHLYDYLLI